MQHVVDTESDPLNVRRGPSTDHPVVGSLDPGTKVDVVSTRGDWRSIGPKQWVYGEYLRSTGCADRRGHAEVIGCREDGGFTARLWNFRTGSSKLKRAHRTFLDRKVAPHLAGGGSLRLVGLASRIGDTDLNRRLSRDRARSAAHHLMSRLRATPRRVTLDAWGEEKARRLGVPDSDNAAVWRAVLVQASEKPSPDPPPITPAGKWIKRKVQLTWREQPEISGPTVTGGERWFQLSSDLMRMASPEPDEVRKARVPVDHEITGIVVRREQTSELNVTATVHTVTYEWGVPGPTVRLDLRGRERDLLRSSRAAHGWMESPGKMLFRPHAAGD